MVLNDDFNLEQTLSVVGVRAIAEYNNKIDEYLNGGTTITSTQKTALADLESMYVFMGAFLMGGYGAEIIFANLKSYRRRAHNMNNYYDILDEWGFTKSDSNYIPHKISSVKFYGPAYGLSREAFTLDNMA